MDAVELITVLCAVLALAMSAAFAVLCSRVLQAARSLEDATRAFDEVATPAVEQLSVAATRATGEIDRLEDLLDVATAVGERVDTATEATYRALTSPVIKGVALASGTRRAVGRLRGRDDDDHRHVTGTRT
jgi:hypothetical protein